MKHARYINEYQIIPKHRTTTMLFHMLMRQLKLLMIQGLVGPLETTVQGGDECLILIQN